MRHIRLGTRGSTLALQQAALVANALHAAHPDISLQTITITTHGDIVSGQHAADIDTPGIFTKELERELAAGRIDIAVHSLKDLPTLLHPELCLAAVLKREHPLDVLVSQHAPRFDALPRGARIGTSSIRRTAQIRSFRSDLTVVPVRGNIETRLRKMREHFCDALVLAHAALVRLGLETMIVEVIPPHIMLPAPGQGAVAVEVRERDTELRTLCIPINDLKTFRETEAERAFLRRLGAGCHMPAGCLARTNEDTMTIQGCIVAPDGSTSVSSTLHGRADDNTEALGIALAEKLLAQGGAEMLEHVRKTDASWFG
ncbi:MAG: hydroxymethylbilane synthase [Desulfobacterota bacterium]|nr:hydroxymethylbilane synthase [Thermodesulfobacteriota bacterium]